MRAVGDRATRRCRSPAAVEHEGRVALVDAGAQFDGDAARGQLPGLLEGADLIAGALQRAERPAGFARSTRRARWPCRCPWARRTGVRPADDAERGTQQQHQQARDECSDRTWTLLGRSRRALRPGMRDASGGHAFTAGARARPAVDRRRPGLPPGSHRAHRGLGGLPVCDLAPVP